MKFTDINGVWIWDEKEIQVREYIINFITTRLKEFAFFNNRAWNFKRIEASPIVRRESISAEYSNSDIFCLNDGLALRGETTGGSYYFAKDLCENIGKKALPICVYQAGMSFRNEQDKTASNIRLKSFYQLEYQFVYDSKTLDDYYSKFTDEAAYIINDLLGGNYKVHLQHQYRKPSYSIETIDIVAFNSFNKKNNKSTDDEFIEVCSMSKRNDSPIESTNVFELAFGLDRLVCLMTSSL